MTIDELKQEKSKLAADLSERIMRFQQRTGCTVKSVVLDHLYNDARVEPVHTKIEVQVDIE